MGEIQNSREDEDCLNSKFFSRLCALLIDRDLRSEPHPHLLLPLCERAARQVLRDLPSFGEQERSKSPLGLLYSREIHNLFGGFCPISGSPVRPSAWSKWGSIPFKKASNTGQSTTGSVSVCCWPCVCDLQEFVKADTLEVETREGRTTF